MLDITQLNKIDINSQKSLSEIKEKVADIMLHNETKEARILYDFINDKLAKNKNSFQEKEYSKILSQLRFLDLYFLSDNEIISLYQNDFGKILEYYEDYIPFNVLRLKLLNMSLRDRDEFKKKVVLALLNNKEVITSYTFVFTKGEKSEAPSVANWIKDYTKIAGGGVFTNMAKANYFIRSKNYLALNDEEKQKVKILLNFYFRLHLSSLTPQGLENDLVFVDKDGKTKILSEGKIIDTSSDMSINAMSIKKRGLKPKDEKEIIDKASGVVSETEKELIGILQEEINQDTGGDFNQLIQMLRQSIKIGAREEIEAILQILRGQDKIKDIQKDFELLKDLRDMDFLDELLREENINQSTKSMKELMREVLIGDKEEEREIKKIEVEVKKNEGDDVKKIIGGLGDAGDVKEAIARLRLLAKISPNSFTKISGSEKEKPSAADFERLIKKILGEKFGLSDIDTARYGMQIAMILKKKNMPEFIKAIYFDKKDGVFRWNTV